MATTDNAPAPSTLRSVFLPPAEYRKAIARFTDEGTVPEAEGHTSDPLFLYLVQTFSDSEIRRLALAGDHARRVCFDTMMRFVSQNLEKDAYRRRRLCAEEALWREAALWSAERRGEGRAQIVERLHGRYATAGFDRTLYDHCAAPAGTAPEAAAWRALLDEWHRLMERSLEDEAARYLIERRAVHNALLRHNLEAAPAYALGRGIGLEAFSRAWALMGGRWNSLEFDRLYAVVRLMKRYPVLDRILSRLGRVPAPDGTARMRTGYGGHHRLAHAVKSDIQGIGIGRDLGAMLPHEWAQCLDPDLENVFLQKLVTGRLQTFEYQSRILSPARSLAQRPARPQGPVVVCVDTSGSMMGEPWRVAQSLVMALTEMCARRSRPCYLVAFSVLARAVDVLTDRTALLQFFARRPGGDTDARRMMHTVHTLLGADPRYAGADVLWITDFRIPLPPRADLEEMQRLRSAQTRFYGLKLGIAQNKWLPYFDELYTIEDIHMAVI